MEQELIGVADCPREGCPSDSHFVTWIKDVDGYVIRTDFECKLCGAIESWPSGEGME
jgi:hypothetical protein